MGLMHALTEQIDLAVNGFEMAHRHPPAIAALPASSDTGFQTRLLPMADWHRLDETDLGPLWRHFPLETQVVVVEHQGVIVGTWAAFRVVHLEGVWIAPDHRKRGAVARGLLRGMRQAVAKLGARRVMTAAMDDEVRRILVGLGAEPLPGDHYVLELGKER